jgi:hypothetical protein
VIHVKLTPSRNEMRFEHIGCDTPTPWIVPLDDCMAPAVGEIEECARCCLLVRIGKVELTEDFDWGGVGVQPAHKAQRGSNVDDYRLHADTGTPLDQEASDGGDPENSGAYV